MSVRVLAGRGAVITGATRGLGLEIARACVRSGAGVVICARDQERLEAARLELEVEAEPGQVVAAIRADVSAQAEVETLVHAAIEVLGRVHILVNNAGVYGPIGPIEDVDWAEWRRAFDINVFGSVLPARALLPHFRAHRYGKIIQLSGGGATNPLPRISAYAASKAAIVRFMETLAEEVRDTGIDVNAIAPGALDTRLLDQLLAAGRDRVGGAFFDKMTKIKASGGTPLSVGASLVVYLASAESDGISGRLLAAVWDPWETLHNHAAEIRGSDIYTLRRIVPADRGKTWGDR